ncbi:hypothetical protein QA596_02295 [Balneolales bacterium ANBcel1]|nr:hypothetical protein [Balneolales bacterium ANBcel1]
MKSIVTFFVLLFLLSSCTAVGNTRSDTENLDLDVFFPRGFGITVNQVGYMQGSNLDHEDGPWRAGIRRNFDVRDYRPIAEIGKEAGVRLVSLFALAEMDRLNIVATLPHATQAGYNFDNHQNIGPKQLEIMDFVKNNAAHIEMGVTGIGHEWWEDGKKVRSEWYDVENSRPRDETMMRRHMDVIKNILWQYGISEENGHSFPESFSAYGYYWNPYGDYSTGGLFHEYGARYGSTRFGGIQELNPPDINHGGIDQGSLILHRGVFGNFWHNYADLPSEDISEYESDIIDGHWANFLATDDFLQPDVNQQFVDHFRKVQRYPYRYLAKNTEQLYSQWLYKEYTRVGFKGTGLAGIDNTHMPDEVYGYDLLGNMVVSIPLQSGQHVSEARLNGNPVPAIFEEEGYGFVYLPILDQQEYELKWSVGTSPMPYTINNTGTYNVYGFDSDDLFWTIRMYGTQEVRFRVPDNYIARSDHPRMKILDQFYDTAVNELVVTIKAHDIQGETGKIRLESR